MVILITGVPGWLGNRLLHYLLEDRDDLRCFIQKGTDSAVVQAPNCEIAYGDVREKTSLRDAFTDVDTVFHLAGVIHPKRIREFYHVNFEGTRNVVEACVERGVQRLIFVSSDAAGGHNLARDRPLTEEDTPLPRGDYGMSKLLAERLVNQAYLDYGLETTILRPCWIYGPGQPQRMTHFMRMIAAGRAPLVGDGCNLRSMTYIDNAVSALLLASTSSKAVGETYLIADAEPYPTFRIYSAVAEALGVRFRPVRVPRLVSVVSESLDCITRRMGINVPSIHVLGELRYDITCSIRKAKEEFGYNPIVCLEEGMQRAVAWCRSVEVF